jgi:hypothetical protein
MRSNIVSLIFGAVALALAVASIVLVNLARISVQELGLFLGIGMLLLSADLLLKSQRKGK